MLDEISMAALIGQEKDAGLFGIAGKAVVGAIKLPGQLMQKLAPKVTGLGMRRVSGPQLPGQGALKIPKPGFVGGVARMAGKVMADTTTSHNIVPGIGMAMMASASIGGYAIEKSKGESKMNKYAGLTQDEQLAIIEMAYQDAEMEKTAFAGAGDAAKNIAGTISRWAKKPGQAIQRAGKSLKAKGHTTINTARPQMAGGKVTKGIKTDPSGVNNPYFSPTVDKTTGGINIARAKFAPRGGVVAATQRGVGAAMKNKYVAHGAAPAALVGVGAGGGAYAYNRRKKSSLTQEDQLAIIEMAYEDAAMEKSAGAKTEALKKGGKKVISFLGTPGRGIQSAGGKLRASGLATAAVKMDPAVPLNPYWKTIPAKNTGIVGKARRGVGAAMQNRFVAHGAVPVGVTGAAGGTYAATRKKKSSDEAAIFADTLQETNFYNALADEVYEWKEANGLIAQ